jgi:hypothetical protein
MTSQIIRIKKQDFLSCIMKMKTLILISKKFFVPNVYFIQIIINNENITEDFATIINQRMDYDKILGKMIVITNKPRIIKERVIYTINELLYGIKE